MSVAVKLERNRAEGSIFNGRLSDFMTGGINNLDPALKDGFTAIAAEDPDTRIMVNYREKINRDTIANQIIRYKDIFKLSGRPVLYPYILYLQKENKERALLLFPYTEDSFIYAKGAYYCLTEQGAEFEEDKNEIVTASPHDSEQLLKIWHDLFRMHAGALQRRIDAENYKSYDELMAKADHAAENLIQEAHEQLPGMGERTKEIYKLVVSWFLIKKVLYVQYMMDRNVLITVHDGNMKKQRYQAKVNADSISFIPYSDLWRMGIKPDVHKMAASNA